MKQFLYMICGGLSAVGCGIAFVYGGLVVWRTSAPYFGFDGDNFSISRSITAAAEEARASTLISGLKKTVRFSAHDEEDVVNMTMQSVSQQGSDVVTAKGYVLKNMTTGSILSEDNTEIIMPIASLTKLVTAVVARRAFDPHDRIKISDDIIATYGNTAGFQEGETFRAEDLLYPLLMVSSNDAAEAFAHEFGRKKFILEMNNFAQEIGAYRTYFADASGLSPNNVSTVNDLLIILDWIQKNDPEIMRITAIKSKTIRIHTWTNPTHFLSWSYYIGGKNGYTPEAERTAVSLFEIGEAKNIYAVIVLGSTSRDADVARLLSRIK